MLTKRDLEQVEEIVQRSINAAIKTAFQDFYIHIFEPYTNINDINEKEHGQLVQEISSMMKEIRGLKDETSEIKECIKDHEKRITHIENIIPVKN